VIILYYVYCHTLKQDGRKYIGITSQNLNSRWKNGNGYKGSTHFKHAIDKYGWDSFSHDVLNICNSKEEAYNLEKYYIAYFGTTNEKLGFNLQSGGESPKQHWSSVKKSANKRKGIKFTGEALEHLRENAKKASEANKGKTRAEETKYKISETHKGMKYGEETKQKLRDAFSVPVLCIELNKIYPSMSIAANEFGISKCTISAVIRGRNKTAAGYHWKLA